MASKKAAEAGAAADDQVISVSKAELKAMLADAAKEGAQAVVSDLASRPDASEEVKELGGDPQARAKRQLMERIRLHKSGQRTFSHDEAVAFCEALEEDEATKCALRATWMRHHARPPREKGSMYPVRQFGATVVSTFPGSDSHLTGRTPDFE